MAPSTSVRQTPRYPSRDDPLSVAVVGVGRWGPTLVRALTEHPDADEIVACDLDADRRKALHTRFPSARTLASYDDVLSDRAIAAVVIATPIHTHAELAMRALSAGKHVLVEKPLALSSEDAQTLVEAAADRHLVLMVGHTARYAPAARVVEQVLRAGQIGRPREWTMHRLNPSAAPNGRDVLWDLGVHDIALLVGWTGVFAPHHLAVERCPDWQDRARLSLAMVIDQQRIELELGAAKTRVRRIHIEGARGGIEWIGLPDADRVVLRDETGVQRLLRVPPNEPLMVQIDDFLGSIRSGQMPLCDGKHGAAVVRLLERIEGELNLRAVSATRT